MPDSLPQHKQILVKQVDGFVLSVLVISIPLPTIPVETVEAIPPDLTTVVLAAHIPNAIRA